MRQRHRYRHLREGLQLLTPTSPRLDLPTPPLVLMPQQLLQALLTRQSHRNPAPTVGFSNMNPYIATPETNYTVAGAGAPAVAAGFSHAPITPIPAPTGGFAATNPYIAPPGTTYASAGAEAQATAAGFPNAPMALIPVPTGGFAPTNLYIAQSGTTNTPAGYFSHTLLSGPRILLHASSMPRTRLPTPTSLHRGIPINTNCPKPFFISAGGSIRIPLHGMPQLQQSSTHAALSSSTRAILPRHA